MSQLIHNTAPTVQYNTVQCSTVQYTQHRAHLDPRLAELQLARELLAHEHVGVGRSLERALQLLQLWVV